MAYDWIFHENQNNSENLSCYIRNRKLANEDNNNNDNSCNDGKELSSQSINDMMEIIPF